MDEDDEDDEANEEEEEEEGDGDEDEDEDDDDEGEEDLGSPRDGAAVRKAALPLQAPTPRVLTAATRKQ